MKDPEEDTLQKRKVVLEEQRHVTEKISELCRYIGFGVAAVNYALFASESNFSAQMVIEYRTEILISSVLAISTIFFDYLQFLFGYKAVRDALSNNDDNYKYKLKSIFYRGRFWFFYLKQFAAFLSIFVLLIMLLMKLLT